MSGRYYNLEEKISILERSKQYATLNEAARSLGVGVRTLGRWSKAEREKHSIGYPEEERKLCAEQVQKHSTWMEASIELGVSPPTLRAWCRKYGYPFPKNKETDKTSKVKIVDKQRSPKKWSAQYVAPPKRELSDDLKEGISNMLADHVPEKTISRLTGIPKGEIKEVITRIMGSSRTSMKRR